MHAAASLPLQVATWWLFQPSVPSVSAACPFSLPETLKSRFTPLSFTPYLIATANPVGSAFKEIQNALLLIPCSLHLV